MAGLTTERLRRGTDDGDALNATVLLKVICDGTCKPAVRDFRRVPNRIRASWSATE